MGVTIYIGMYIDNLRTLLLQNHLPRKALVLAKETSDIVDPNAVRSKSCGVGWDHSGEPILQKNILIIHKNKNIIIYGFTYTGNFFILCLLFFFIYSGPTCIIPHCPNSVYFDSI